MSKTADLRELIQSQLSTVTGGTYYRHATDDAVYPYKTFSLSRVTLVDSARDDIDLCIDIWDHATDSKVIDAIGDDIEDLFNVKNLPQGTILPTFFRDSRYPVDEDDKTMQHVQMHVMIQNYKRGE